MRRADRIELCARRALDNPAYARNARRWYADARAWCSDLASVDYHGKRYSWQQVAGIVAALSPMNAWESQLRYTPEILYAIAAGAPIPGPGFSRNKDKAHAIGNGAPVLDTLSGNKVRAFYRCITGDTNAVCVDRHAHAIASGLDARPLTGKRYRDTATAFRECAARLNIPAPELQALTWCYWRDHPEERF